MQGVKIPLRGIFPTHYSVTGVFLEILIDGFYYRQRYAVEYGLKEELGLNREKSFREGIVGMSNDIERSSLTV